VQTMVLQLSTLPNTRKIICSFILLLLSGCSENRSWIYQKVVSDFPQFKSSLQTSRIENEFTSFEVQFLKGRFGIVGFFNLYTQMTCCSHFTLVIQEKSFSFDGIVMAGGQRLLLPADATTTILEALNQCCLVAITWDRFYAVLTP
jgi:hypothetical protein